MTISFGCAKHSLLRSVNGVCAEPTAKYHLVKANHLPFVIAQFGEIQSDSITHLDVVILCCLSAHYDDLLIARLQPATSHDEWLVHIAANGNANQIRAQPGFLELLSLTQNRCGMGKPNFSFLHSVQGLGHLDRPVKAVLIVEI